MSDTAFPELNPARSPKLASLRGNYVFFYPLSDQKFLTNSFAKIDCETSCLNLTSLSNPYCIQNNKGLVSITITKTIGKPYLTISR
jgi:hypothetical protein